jgi:hypothetical protein
MLIAIIFTLVVCIVIWVSISVVGGSSSASTDWQSSLSPGLSSGLSSSGGRGWRSGPMDVYTLLQGGIPARGILLRVGSQLSAQGTAQQGFYEVRAVQIDVQVAGNAPYQCDCSLYVPANMRRLVLPGATVELRVDPNGPGNIALFGPGVGLSAVGFS